MMMTYPQLHLTALWNLCKPRLLYPSHFHHQKMPLGQTAPAHNLQKNYMAVIVILISYLYVSKPAVRGFVHADSKKPNSYSGILAISWHTSSTFKPLLNCSHSAIDWKIVWCKNTVLEISSLFVKEAWASGFV